MKIILSERKLLVKKKGYLEEKTFFAKKNVFSICQKLKRNSY